MYSTDTPTRSDPRVLVMLVVFLASGLLLLRPVTLFSASSCCFLPLQRASQSSPDFHAVDSIEHIVRLFEITGLHWLIW